MKIDTRLFKYAGTSLHSSGEYKARFANSVETRPKILEKLGNTDTVLVELPTPMTKSEAIAYLQDTKPEGVNQDALVAKTVYIKAQYDKLNGPRRKRGRPAKAKAAVSESVDTLVTNIVANRFTGSQTDKYTYGAVAGQ